MRLLVIVSGDYGTLGEAMYFLPGVRSTRAPVLLLPTALAHTVATSLEREVRIYASLADIRRTVIELRPDAAILMSGYLLPLNSGLSLLDFIGLLRLLRHRGVALLTTDPFFGLLRDNIWELDFRDLSPRSSHGRGSLIATLRDLCPWFLLRFRYICPLFLVWSQLRRVWHIYPAPTGRMRPEPGARRLSFFNPEAQSASPAESADGGQPPVWLFVLSKTDFDMQFRAHGDRFVALVIDRIQDSIALGRNALLICPQDLAVAARARLGTRVGIAAHNDTTYAGYMRSLMTAEYVFYWNMFSFSVIHRMLAGRPVFFFDEGHIVRILPAIGEEAIRLIYDGWCPPVLPLDKPLDEQELAQREADVRKQFQLIVDGLHGCSSPNEVLQRVRAERNAEAA